MFFLISKFSCLTLLIEHVSHMITVKPLHAIIYLIHMVSQISLLIYNMVRETRMASVCHYVQIQKQMMDHWLI
jgi:hypothetical protein